MMKTLVKSMFFAALVPLAIACNNSEAPAEEAAPASEAATVEPVTTDQSESMATAATTETTTVPAPSNTANAAQSAPTANAKAVPAKKVEVEEVSRPVTSIKFDNIKYDWGTIKQGQSVSHTFRVTNTGNAPLVIANAKASCGCTVPDWTKAPIPPGKTGEIKVKFDSTGKSGQTTKTVTVTANTEPENTVLTITGKIDAPAGAQSDE